MRCRSVVVLCAVLAWAVLTPPRALAQAQRLEAASLVFTSPSHEERTIGDARAVTVYYVEWWQADTGSRLGGIAVPAESVASGSSSELSLALADLPVPRGVALMFSVTARGAMADSSRSAFTSPITFEPVSPAVDADSVAQPAASAASGGPQIGRPTRFAGATRDGVEFEATTLVEGLERATAFAALPDGRLLVADAYGRVLQVADGRLVDHPMLAWRGVRIHGIVADPSFAETGWLYLAATTEARGDGSTMIVRVREVAGRLSEAAVMLDTLPGGPDVAGALQLGPDGDLYVGTADRAGASAAQDLGDAAGKILRLTREGRPAGALGLGFVHAWGFSDGRVFAWDATGRSLWQLERSADGLTTDVNRVEPQANYGWAAGGAVGAAPRAPILQWTPGAPPLAALVYEGVAFPSLRGDLLVIAADRPGLVRVPADQLREPSGALEAWLQEAGVLSALAVGADGALYLLAADESLAGGGVGERSRLIRVVPPARDPSAPAGSAPFGLRPRP